MAATTDTLAQTPADVDPTRTKTLRKKYGQKLRGKFAEINTEIRSGIVDRDVFRLTDSRDTLASPLPSQFPSRRDRQIESFDAWLDRQMEDDVLGAIDPNRNQFVRSSYQRGLDRAGIEARQAGVSTPGGDIGSVINRPIHRDELQLAYTRDYSQLEGITSAVSQQSNRVLAEGLAEGLGPKEIARNITDRVDKIGKTRATTLARTSVIDTFNAAKLNRFEELGVGQVGVKAEWMTAGDSRVCPRCASREGNTYKINEARGLIPLHPQCRCTFTPISAQ